MKPPEKHIASASHKVFSSEVKLSPDDDRAVIATISTISTDRDGEVLVPLGMRSKDFKKNPMVFYQHNYDCPVGVVQSLKQNEESIEAKVRFNERPPKHPENLEWWPDTLLWLYKEQAMKGWSVGFRPLEQRPASDRDRVKFGDECSLVTGKWDLFELSAVGLGCNPDAVTTAVGKGLMTQATADKMFNPGTVEKTAESGEILEKVLENIENLVENLGKTADSEPKTATCAECEKEYPAADMTMDDGEYVCAECAEKMTDPADDSDEKGKKAAPEPELAVALVDAPAEHKSFFDAETVVAVIDAPIATKAVAVEEFVYCMADAPPLPGGKSVEMVIADGVRCAVSKARGMIYIQE